MIPFAKVVLVGNEYVVMTHNNRFARMHRHCVDADDDAEMLHAAFAAHPVVKAAVAWVAAVDAFEAADRASDAAASMSDVRVAENALRDAVKGNQ